MSDEDALLAAIRANPGDDLPRLVYADWLEEGGTEDGARRAAFIRLHIAYANETRKTYRRRMRGEIKRALYGAVSLRSLPWVNRILDVYGMGLHVDGWCYSVGPLSPQLRVRRGFVEEIALFSSVLMWAPLHVGMVFSEQPVTKVTLINREPSHDFFTNGNEDDPSAPVAEEWDWFREDSQFSAADNSFVLPAAVYDLLEDGREEDGVRSYPTREEALTALANACVRYGHSLVVEPAPV